MSQWPPVPSITLSSRSTRWLSAGALSSVARRAGVAGLDLDLAKRSVTVGGLSGGPRLDPSLAGSIDSLWLPLERGPRCGAARADRLVEGWIALANQLDIRRVVVDREAAMRPIGDGDKRPLLIRLQEGTGPTTRIAVVLRPRSLEGNRAHLTSVSAFRRTAEEWDFDLALDLLGAIDPRWEAEAALQRILGRLTLVRLGSTAPDHGPAGRSRLSRRTLSWLIDQSYPGTLSLVPRARWSGAIGGEALARRVRDEARTITDRHQRTFSAPMATTRLVSPQER